MGGALWLGFHGGGGLHCGILGAYSSKVCIVAYVWKEHVLYRGVTIACGYGDSWSSCIVKV